MMEDLFSHPLFWLLANLFSTAVLAFYSMSEMAAVSFNPLRLEYLVYKKDKNALLLNSLLKHSSRLFGTTLIGVNVAMFIGSECARKFHEEMGINPDLAPLSQVFLVVLLGELAPMFAARQFSEYVALKCSTLLNFSSKFLSPFVFLIDKTTQLLERLIGKKISHSTLLFSQEELLKILEDQDSEIPVGTSLESEAIASNLFKFQHKTALDVMRPLALVPKIPSNTSVDDFRDFMSRHPSILFAPIYHRELNKIIAIATPRDCLRANGKERIRDFVKTAWFITETTPIFSMIQQFKRNNENVGIILNSKGEASGLVTIEDVLNALFGKKTGEDVKTFSLLANKKLFLDKIFPASTSVESIQKQFNLLLNQEKELTLAELLLETLGNVPEENERIYLENVEITALEVSLKGIQKVHLKT